MTNNNLFHIMQTEYKITTLAVIHPGHGLMVKSEKGFNCLTVSYCAWCRDMYAPNADNVYQKAGFNITHKICPDHLDKFTTQ